MINEKLRAEIDQAISFMIEVYPVQWRQLYLKLIEEGFTKVEALDLVKTFITTNCKNTNT